MGRRWKWFQRPEEPVDVVQTTTYPERAGAYRTGQHPATWEQQDRQSPRDAVTNRS